MHCAEDEQCRDGNCVKVVGTFCFSSFDCGLSLKCETNRCVPEKRGADLLERPKTRRCDPGEVYVNHKCEPQPGKSNKNF